MQNLAVNNGSSIAAAATNGTLAFGFSGSGFLLFYFVGVSSVLRDLRLINGSTSLAGASGGSIASAATCAGVDSAKQFKGLRKVARTCRPSNGCRGFLDSAVYKQLQAILPADAAERCSGQLFVAVTEAQPRGQPDTPLLLGSNWTDTQQLILALRASSYIPVQSGRAATLQLPWLPGTGAVYDGGFTVDVPCPPGAAYCVKVSARAQDPPALTPPAAAAQLTQTAPNSTTQRNSTGASAPAALFDGGQAAAPGPAADGATGAAGNAASASGSDALLLLNTLLSNSKNESGTGPFLPLNPMPARQGSHDIFPGLSGRLLVPARTWNSYSLSIPDDATLQYLYDVGRMDAAYWAVSSQLASPQQAIQALVGTQLAE